MRQVVAITKNVSALSLAYEALEGRETGVPGMGLVYGYTGAGKTHAVTWQVNRCNGVYVRATSAWTPTSMLAKVMEELGAAPLQRRAAMLDWIATQLVEQNRALFVDECDKFVANVQMLECLRDLHDISGRPVVMIGEEGIPKRLRGNARLSRRITEWVEFLPSDLDDAAVLAKTICEVPPDDELLHHVHQQAAGSVGLMTVGLSRIERFGRAQGLQVVTAEAWADRPLNLRSVQG